MWESVRRWCFVSKGLIRETKILKNLRPYWKRRVLSLSVSFSINRIKCTKLMSNDVSQWGRREKNLKKNPAWSTVEPESVSSLEGNCNSQLPSENHLGIGKSAAERVWPFATGTAEQLYFQCEITLRGLYSCKRGPYPLLTHFFCVFCSRCLKPSDFHACVFMCVANMCVSYHCWMFILFVQSNLDITSPG